MSSTQRHPARSATLSRSCTSSRGQGSGSGYGNSGGRTIAVMTAAAARSATPKRSPRGNRWGRSQIRGGRGNHRVSPALAAPPQRRRPCSCGTGSHEREEGAPDEKRPGTEPIRRHARALGGAIEVRRQKRPADVGCNLFVEERFDREGAGPLRGIGRIEGWGRGAGAHLGEDPVRPDEWRAVDHEDRELVLPGEEADARHVEAGDERPADVRPALVIERPAHLLVVVRDAEVEEAWRRHGGE